MSEDDHEVHRFDDDGGPHPPEEEIPLPFDDGPTPEQLDEAYADECAHFHDDEDLFFADDVEDFD